MSFLTSLSMWDLVLFAIALLGLLYLYATWNYGHFTRHGVPFLKPYPMLGNLKESTFGTRPVYLDMDEIYQKMKGNAFCGYFKFRDPGILILDPDLLRLVMAKDFQSFHDNDIEVSVDVDPMFGRNPFCLRGDKWKTVRGQLTPAFTPGKLKPLFPFINEVCKELNEYLVKEQPEALEAKEVAAKFTTDCVATCAFGLNGNSFTDPNAQFRSMGRDMLKADFWKNLQLLIVFMAPALSRVLKLRLFNEAVTDFFRNVVKDTISYRDKNKVVRNDFLALLMQLKAKGTVEDDSKLDSKNRFTDEDVAGQAITFFSEGFETSSIVLSFTLYELAANPDVQRKLRADIDAALARHGGVLSYELLQEIPYIEMVFSETLRKYPPAAVLTRVCTQPYELTKADGSVHKVAVGTPVSIPVLGLHKDPDYYPDPDRFDPERFTEANKAARHPYTYIPFGAGPRACLGQRFANMQVKAGMVSIVSTFELTVDDRTCVPITYDPHYFMMLAKGGLWLKFKKLERK